MTTTLDCTQWATDAVTLLDQLNVPVIEANSSRLPATGRIVDFRPDHPLDEGFKTLVHVTQPKIAVVWPEFTEEGDLVQWNLHLFGERDILISCGDPAEPRPQLAHSDDQDGYAEPVSDVEAFEANESLLRPHLTPAVDLVLSLALEKHLEPDDDAISDLFDTYVATLDVEEPLRQLLRGYLPFYGRHRIDDGLIEAHRADFRRRAPEYAQEILNQESGLEGLKKPVLVSIVWTYMKRTHSERCAAKYIMEPIADEIRRLIRESGGTS